MELIHDLEHKRSAMYVMSIIGLILGIFTVLLHNFWYASLLDVIVTLVGWVILVKSTLYLSLPTKMIHKIVRAMALPRNYHLYTIISLIIGLYLALNGAWAY